MKTKISLIALFLFVSLSIFGKNTQVNTTNTSYNQVEKVAYCGVTEIEIFEYMASHGFHVASIMQINGSCDVFVKTTINKSFVVYISEGIITGFEEVSL